MKKILTIAMAIWFCSMANAQSNLVIQMNTDKYPEENKWILFNLDNDTIQEQNVFLPDTINLDTVVLGADACYYLTIYDRYGDGMSQSNDDAGYKVFIDGEIVAQSEDANFGDSVVIYGLGEACVDVDMMVDELTFKNEQLFDPFIVSANVANVGATNINSITFTYVLGGVDGPEFTIDTLNLFPGDKLAVECFKRVELVVPGDYEVGLKILKVNGEPDQNTSNDVKTQTVTINSGYKFKPMHQVFTSSTCGPCVNGNYMIDLALDHYEPNEYALVKYQVNWPGTGDPYYTADVSRIKTFYKVNQVPTFYVNNTMENPAEYKADKFATYAQESSDLGLVLEANMIGDTVDVNVTVNSIADFDEELFIRLMVVEKTTYGNASTNGETQFHNVHMKFMSGWPGNSIGIPAIGMRETFNFKSSMQGTFIEEFDDLRVVAYIFADENYRILQSDMIDLPYTAIAPEITFNIAADSSNVDTLPEIVINTNRELVKTDDTEISNLSEIIEFKENSDDGAVVEFTGEYDVEDNEITIVPNANLKEGTEYIVKLVNVKSTEGVLVENAFTTFTTLKTVGISGKQQSIFNAYPNPVANNLTIDLEVPATVTIYDITGKTILVTSVLNTGQSNINVSTLGKGVYLLKVTSNGYTYEQKLIKN